jgi:hypothetical protein
MRPTGLALLALLLATSTARAQTRLAVVELAAPQNLSGISAKLTQDIVELASKEPQTTVLQPFDVAKALGAEALKRVGECNGKPRCIAQYAGTLPADRLVVGSLDRTETSYLVRLWLVDLKSQTVVSQVDRSILIASRRLQADVASTIPGLLAGKAEALGKITISATRGATIYFDGEVAGRAPMTLETKPGKHTLKLTKQGYLDVERFVTVPENATEEVTLALLAVPGAKTQEEEELPMLVKKAPESGGGSSITIPVASWVLGGTAIASAGVATIFAVSAGSLTNKAGDATGTPAAYGISRTDAQAGKRDAIVADVLFGVAGASAATAVILGFVLQEPAAAADATPKAAVAPLRGGAAFTLSGSF